MKQSLPALLNQSLENFEILLMDNGSQDDTPEIAASFQDKRLRVFRNENLGLALAYNVGLANARGKYIALCNSDDLWFEQKLEKQKAAIEKGPAGVIFTSAELIDDDGKTVSEEVAARFPFSFENLPQAATYEKLFFHTNFFVAPSALIRKELLDANPFYPMLLQLQDFDMWVKLIQKTEFEVLPEKLIGYRVRVDGSNVSLNTGNRSRILLELSIAYKRFFEGVDSEFFRKAFAKRLRNPEFSGELALEFEKAFLYLQMSEPAIRFLGLEKLYELMGIEEGRVIAHRDYNLSMADVWNYALSPVYADLASFKESEQDIVDLCNKLKSAERELARTRETMRQITSGKFWKLREKVYEMLKKN